jgi:lipoate-protein ligase B
MTTWKTVYLKGPYPYRPILDLQYRLVAARREGTLNTDVVLCLEHTQVFTLGHNGGIENIKVSPAFLRTRRIEVVKVERGGNITYHGPGQLIAYPIIDLRQSRTRIATYVEALEEVMIRAAADCDVRATRDSLNHGVWVGSRKLGSIGIAVRHGITFHGLALNVNLDLQPFSWIAPCGLANISMTSLKEVSGRDRDMDVIRERLIRHMEDVFEVSLQNWEISDFTREFPIDFSYTEAQIL